MKSAFTIKAILRFAYWAHKFWIVYPFLIDKYVLTVWSWAAWIYIRVWIKMNFKGHLKELIFNIWIIELSQIRSVYLILTFINWTVDRYLFATQLCCNMLLYAVFMKQMPTFIQQEVILRQYFVKTNIALGLLFPLLWIFNYLLHILFLQGLYKFSGWLVDEWWIYRL